MNFSFQALLESAAASGTISTAAMLSLLIAHRFLPDFSRNLFYGKRYSGKATESGGMGPFSGKHNSAGFKAIPCPVSGLYFLVNQGSVRLPASQGRAAFWRDRPDPATSFSGTLRALPEPRGRSKKGPGIPIAGSRGCGFRFLNYSLICVVRP